jgi:ferredoxin
MAHYIIQVDREQCVGDKACTEEAPSTFALDEEMKVVVVDPEGDPPENILWAAQACPFQGIVLHDAQTGVQVWPKVRRVV